jgi:hypothetical protein
MMTERERFIATMTYQPVDVRPLQLAGPWPDTLARWHREGLPAEVEDVHAWLGLKSLKILNVVGRLGPLPAYETRVVEERGNEIIKIDGWGRTIRDFKAHTSMPEWIEFPVKNAEDLRRFLDEHFDPSHMDERFDADWEARMTEALADTESLIMTDGGCYYNTLRHIAGLETTSYLLYDAPELVEELFERYLAFDLESLRRAASRGVRLDIIGYGEDLAYKTAPLLSIEMFRRMILPRYRRFLEESVKTGARLTWYDSDGDVRMFIPDYLSVGINCFWPCEAAANMDPVALRKTYGKDIRMVGGFDKRLVAAGPAAIQAEFARLRPVIREGGYVPAIDHSISADISFDNYRYFLDELMGALGR